MITLRKFIASLMALPAVLRAAVSKDAIADFGAVTYTVHTISSERQYTKDGRCFYRFMCSCGETSKPFEVGIVANGSGTWVKLKPFKDAFSWTKYPQYNEFARHEHRK